MSSKKYWYTKTDGPDKNAVIQAIIWLIANTKETAYIAVMGYGNLQGYITEVLGEKVC